MLVADDGPTEADWVPDGHEFALCLTHDVDRPYKTYQGLYYAIRNRDHRHLLDLLPGRNPYWTFEDVLAIEREFGVRSAFYFLSEQSLFTDRPLSDLLRPSAWRLYAGRYDLADPAIVELISHLEDEGWEVGLHGSHGAVDDRGRLRREKRRLEAYTETPLTGGRQHYLRLERPRTWEHYRAIGLDYDATLGSPEKVGFQHGYGPFRPFDDEFVVFPLTTMEDALPDPSEEDERAREVCKELLDEAAEEGAVMTVLWHPRYFCERDHPGYRDLYRLLIEGALDRGAWVGPPGELYEMAVREPVRAR